MKAGIAAAVFAAEAIRRAGVELNGSVEISGTVDEESGGFAGVAWLAQHGRLSADRTDFVIIPEPLYVDRICIGHRGVYWFEVLTQRAHRPRQHAVPRRERDRAHGRCCSIASTASCSRGSRRGRRRCR